MEYKGYKGIIPKQKTLDQWFYTRKRSKADFLPIGSFKFPGMRTTQKFWNDGVFFWLAVLLEVGFLIAVSIMVGGFDFFLSIAAVLCVALDFLGAYSHHKNADEISKAQLSLQIEEYKLGIGRTNSDNLKKKREQLQRLRNSLNRKLGITLILVSAFLKVFGSAILFEIPTFTIVLTVLYAFVAWIHVMKTGFYYSGNRFYSSLNRDLSKHIDTDDTLQKKNSEEDFERFEIENIPSGVELRAIKRRIFENVDIFDSLHQIDGKWGYRFWKHHRWDDDDMVKFIHSQDKDGHVLQDAAKAFIAVDVWERNLLK